MIRLNVPFGIKLAYGTEKQYNIGVRWCEV